MSFRKEELVFLCVMKPGLGLFSFYSRLDEYTEEASLGATLFFWLFSYHTVAETCTCMAKDDLGADFKSITATSSL